MPITPDTLPPHIPDAEKAAIGCALADPALAAELRPEWFYDLRHRAAAEALAGMAGASKSISAETLACELRGSGMDNPTGLTMECMDACTSPQNWPYWRDQLSDALALREVVRTAQRAMQAAREQPVVVSDLLDTFEREALAIRQQRQGTQGGERSIRELLRELVDDYDAAHHNGRPVGIATGFCDLDKIIGGMKPQQLIVVAARPSVGKTSLALNIAERVAVDDNVPVGFFSLEMSAKELVHRLSCCRARVDGSALNAGNLSDADTKRLVVAHGALARAPLDICDRGGLTLAQLTARARRMVQQHKIKLLIVDYLGLLRSGEKGRSRYEETTLVSNGLKALAKELGLPVIALAQLNRDTERDGRVPRLSDLRDSGAIEQDADVVMLLHADQDKGDANPVMSIVVSKNRNGRIGRANLVFRRSFTRFENIAP